MVRLRLYFCLYKNLDTSNFQLKGVVLSLLYLLGLKDSIQSIGLSGTSLRI